MINNNNNFFCGRRSVIGSRENAADRSHLCLSLSLFADGASSFLSRTYVEGNCMGSRHSVHSVNDWVVEKVRHDHVTKCKQEKAWARGQHEAFPTMDHVADHRLHDHHSFMAIQVDPSY